jgi:DNA (cytosine-5)-methyltransferase 1
MKLVSLFSGAGGMDVGFKSEGFDIVWANDFNKKACQTYESNLGSHIRCGDINNYLSELNSLKNIDLVIGGPPCQGFSVAGKMDPSDPRSQHVWTFANIVELMSPKAFVMENVKALGTLSKWEPLRRLLLKKFRDLGYSTNFTVLNATDFGVPQGRERVFFIGFKGNSKIIPDLNKMLIPYKVPAKTVRETLSVLDRAGSGNNANVCNAKITITPNPVLRKSPYAGMLFNGLGRPIRIDGFANTLPASMGGNKTPIIDSEELYNNATSWVEEYHASLMNGESPLEFQIAPKRLRRITIKEAALLQSFPLDYIFEGSQSSIYTQIGNAVPCQLASRIAKMIMNCLINDEVENSFIEVPYQLDIESYV